MLQSQTMPVWMQPIPLEGWPTRLVIDESLKYRLPVCEHWQLKPMLNQTSVEQEHIFQGTQPGEILTVSHMNQANPEHNLNQWVDALIHLTGLPIVHWQSMATVPQLVEWQNVDAPLDLCRHLQVDEVCLYQGLAKISNTPTRLLRTYTLLSRRDTEAWKITLAFSSACLPGVPAKMVERNDHVRAGASFGYLQLL